MIDARAKRASFIVKYANLQCSGHCRRSACRSSRYTNSHTNPTKAVDGHKARWLKVTEKRRRNIGRILARELLGPNRDPKQN